MFKYRDDSQGSWSAEVSWYAAPYTPLGDTHAVHLVRHPLDVIASMAARPAHPHTTKHVERWIKGFGSIHDPLERACVYWAEWTQLVTADQVLQLEHVTAGMVTALARRVDPLADDAQLPPYRLNESTYPVPELDWTDVNSSVRAMAGKLGYLALDSASHP